MFPLHFAPKPGSPLRVLCLGAHSDDIEIGCGGAILRLLDQYPGADVTWVVLSAAGERGAEAALGANLFLEKAAARRVILREYATSFFPYIGAGIKDSFEDLKQTTDPDVIFTHRREDLHQDHRLVSELTWNTFRDHLILEYEIAKYEGDLGQPNVFVAVDEEACRKKISYLMDTFATQRDKHWFTADTFLALLRLRGVECRSPTRYAEGFHCRKLVVR